MTLYTQRADLPRLLLADVRTALDAQSAFNLASREGYDYVYDNYGNRFKSTNVAGFIRRYDGNFTDIK